MELLMSHFTFRSALVALAVLAMGGGACRKSAPEVPPPAALALPPLEVAREGGPKWLYTYVDDKGDFVTTDDAKAIPEGARRMVRVTDPAWAAGERKDGVSVYAIDARELLAAGKTQARALSRSAFETGALAQLPPGESSALPGGAAPGQPAPEGEANTPPPPAGGAPVVTLYGTSWCGACRSARQYLIAHKIPFADKDIEKDPAAARELATKGARFGIATDRVPVLEVRGRLLLGFDQRRLEALLGEST
jgi:mycoredoxin